MPNPDEDQSDFQQPSTPAEDLPAVQPPTTSFFVQLFFLPAVIVFGLMLVWFLFGKISDPNRSPEEFLEIIASGRGDRWKAAHDLSQLLKGNSKYANDPVLASKVTMAFEEALAASSSPTQNEALYLEYLAGALGQFNTPVGVPALRQATSPGRPENVRWAALFSIAKLKEKMDNLEDPNVLFQMKTLLADEQTSIRELAALTLGRLADPLSIPWLEDAVNDPEPTVRYNAARALAELGSDAGLPVYKEMLDKPKLEKLFTVSVPSGEDVVDAVRVNMVVYEALRGLAVLHETNPDLELGSLRTSIESVANDANPALASEAKELLLKLK